MRLAPKDEGMSLGGAISALELKGACMEKNWPFNISRVNDKPSDACFNEAVRYKIAESKKVDVDLASMRQCLAEGRVNTEHGSIYYSPCAKSHINN